MKVDLKINNIQPGYNEPYVVARLIDGKVWYWGRYETIEEAESIAEHFDNAVVMEVVND